MSEMGMNIIKEHFPNIDNECLIYITGLLDNGLEDLESAEEFYNAVGGMLFDFSSSDNHDHVKHICNQLYLSACNGNINVEEIGRNPLRRLETPLQMSNGTSQHKEVEINFWIDKKKSATKICAKKLEKAESKLKEKLDKRSATDVIKPLYQYVPNTASVSQQSNKREMKSDMAGTNKNYDIHIENFDISFGDRSLLSGADLHLVYGRRYGIIGRNGIGKTTMLKMMANRQLHIPQHMTILHVEQEVAGGNELAIDCVLACDIKRNNLLKEEKALVSLIQSTASQQDTDNSSRLSEIYTELQAIEADKAPAKAAMILNGLGFDHTDQNRPTKEFSGGWRMRISLAMALFSRPDILLLDEPTNMLDMKAVIWLENYLQDWPSTILVVSHDREFLNSIATDIMHVHSQRIDAYRGSYEDFAKTRDEKLKNQQREYEAQKEYRDHIQIFIDRFRYNANRASQVQSKIKILEKLPVLVPVEKDNEVVFRFGEVEKLSPPILQLDEATFYYVKNKPIFNNVNLSADMDSRICIVGANGTGKTTLLKVLLGGLDLVSGQRMVHRNLRMGYFCQHHVDQMDLNKTSVEILAEKFPGLTTENYRNQLGQFGITGELGMRPAFSLSGGQKSRVAFALLCMARPNFLILDEPTNHLDMQTIEALSHTLLKFQGGVMIVSHDERLIRTVCKEVWLCADKNVRCIEGGIDEYKRIVTAEMLEATKG